MSIKATLQFIAKIHHFCNIDMPNQGTFRLGLSIYQEIKNHKIYATPFQLAKQPKKPSKGTRKIILPAQTTITHFYSKVAIVKYVDEKIMLNDLIRFKLEVQSFPTLQSEEIYIKIDLHFSPKYPSEDDKTFSGRIVTSKIFRVESIESGILNYFQPEFMDQYLSKCGITIFGCVSNFKFGKYKLPYIEEVAKEIEGGEVIIEKQSSSTGTKKTLKQKQIARLSINSFEQMLAWVQKFYQNKIANPLLYFYSAYVKNLRYYFYLTQQKTAHKLKTNKTTLIKVPQEFYSLQQDNPIKQSSLSIEAIFQKYMTNYEPKDLSTSKIFKQLNEIYGDIFYYLQEMEDSFFQNQLKEGELFQQYNSYLRQLYGERVFKSIVDYNDSQHSEKPHLLHQANSEQNKKIARKMRSKESSSVVEYPLVDTDFLNNKANLEYVFYEITYPPKNKKVQMASMMREEEEKMEECSKQEIFEESNNKMAKNELKVQNGKQEIQSNKQENNKQENKQELSQMQEKQERKNSFEEEQFAKNKEGEVNSEVFGSQISDIEAKNNAKSDKGERDLGEEHQYLINHQDYESHHSLENNQFLEEEELTDYDEKDMLFVMCHGFQGSSYDMMLIYRGLKQNFPKANFLPARSNESQTNGNIDQMGKRLANEVVAFIKNYLDEDRVIINMIGHSMGGIIARAGLKYLPKKLDKFGLYFSLSSPHLGYLHGVQKKIRTGLWIIRKVNPTLSLEQLAMEDNSDPRKSFLYKLSLEGSLKKFRKIILWSSFEDSYVAWHSARIMVHQHKSKTSGIRVEQEMVENILGNSPIHRLDMNFNVKKNNIDGLIGRTAHINLIIQESLFKIVNSTIPDLFDIRKY